MKIVKPITKFLKKKSKKIIAVTYQSLHKFIDSLNETDKMIDLLIYDEAHHIIGNTAQKLVFNNDTFNKKTKNIIFLTATPKNDNGIKMLERFYENEPSDSETK